MKKLFSSVVFAVAMFAMVACASGPSFSNLMKAVEAGDAAKAAQIAYDLEQKGVEPTEEQQAELDAAMKAQGTNFCFEFAAAAMAIVMEAEKNEAN